MYNFLKNITFLLMIGSSFYCNASAKNEVMNLGFREKTIPITLSSGEIIQLEGVAKVYATGSDAWVLILNYRSNTLELKELRKKAELIWPRFQPMVEEMGLRYAGIHAKKYPVENPTAETKFVGHNFILFQQSDGKWTFMDDVK